MNDSLDWIKEIVAVYAPKVALALAALVVGWFLIAWVVSIFRRSMDKSEIDLSLRNFLVTLVSITLKVLLLFTVANTFGIVTTSFIAVFGAAGLALGLALQGSLSHFAAGVLILFFKPYRIGDYVEVSDKAGTVKEIQVFTTLLTTLNNNLVIVPNGEVLKYAIVNYSALEQRKVALDIRIRYGDDIDRARDIIERLFRNHELVLVDKGIEVYVASHGESAIHLTARAWARSEDYGTVNFYMLEQVKKEFDKAGIGIPVPQMDVHFPGRNELIQD